MGFIAGPAAKFGGLGLIGRALFKDKKPVDKRVSQTNPGGTSSLISDQRNIY